MVAIAESLEIIARQLFSFLAFALPVVATFVAVFLGVYLNGVIDREREREKEVFRPLFDETLEVKDAAPHRPIRFIHGNDTHQSALFDIRPEVFYSVDQTTRSKVMAYQEAVNRLTDLADTTVSASVILYECGYGEFLENQLPEEMLMESDEGIGSGDAADGLGPHIVAGRETVISGRNTVTPSSSTQIHGDKRIPLLPLLIENAPSLKQVGSSDELRSFFESHTEVDVIYLDERCPNWVDALWDTLQQPWESEAIEYQNGMFGLNVVPEDQFHRMVSGEDFRSILSSAGTALEHRRFKQRERVISHAEDLHDMLLFRLSLPLYHHKRILLARQ